MSEDSSPPPKHHVPDFPGCRDPQCRDGHPDQQPTTRGNGVPSFYAPLAPEAIGVRGAGSARPTGGVRPVAATRSAWEPTGPGLAAPSSRGCPWALTALTVTDGAAPPGVRDTSHDLACVAQPGARWSRSEPVVLTPRARLLSIPRWWSGAHLAQHSMVSTSSICIWR
ncbi:predicted protein [Verticillium alfalfae VaMs.102]|uniref:Predicted protein n=1 Tax=Verticillium alfalfae (strain VaMs.102 / ATCC MYA-4576 / FGSC 10136) TaxID=526221 RepID=C9SP17_VERA1|nr:predicted protein [Verticillium alfalfae VaMs.102]EEY20532.1 predicted protein [Verticillium alfalfae VaMs.102]